MGEKSLLDLVRPVWSEGKTAAELQVSKQELQQLVKDREVLGLTASDSTVLRFPVWQFGRREGKVCTLPLLQNFFIETAFAEPWTVVIYCHSSDAILDSLTPIQYARQRQDIQPMLQFAHVLWQEHNR